jgi:23S rRNA (cytosine1962-C5)-methyltransferase
VRPLALSKSGINKFRADQFELKVSDFEDSIKPLPPGEWCLFKVSSIEFAFGFVNPLVEERYACAHILGKLNPDDIKTFDPEMVISQKIREAYKKRTQFNGYGKSSRIFYGASDGLPGLIIDSFVNAFIIQINTAGLDRYRELIKKEASQLMEMPAFFLDNPKYREKESLPIFEPESFPELKVVENGLRYNIRAEVLQKVGYYYDHRENRYQLMQLLSRLNKKPLKGIDLFSYVGAWGMSALKAGVGEVIFVDQGDFENEVNEALTINEFIGRGKFFRKDVFKFLDESILDNQKYDLILCDPPAFAKSASHKSQALEGYSKLHRKVFRSITSDGLIAFSSCTHYVSHEEFQKNILESAKKENKKIQLVYSGIQGFDHPVKSLDDRSNYIKSYFYIVE